MAQRVVSTSSFFQIALPQKCMYVVDVNPPKLIRFSAVLKLVAAHILLSSNVFSEESSLFTVLIIVILKSRSTAETETFQFSISPYQFFRKMN